MLILPGYKIKRSDRCTLGEISLALEEVWARHRPSTAVVRGAYGASYSESDEVW